MTRHEMSFTPQFIARLKLHNLTQYTALKIGGTKSSFRCTNGDFYVALGSSMSLALLVWVGGGLLKRVLYFFDNQTSLDGNSLILLLTHTKPLPLKHVSISMCHLFESL